MLKRLRPPARMLSSWVSLLLNPSLSPFADQRVLFLLCFVCETAATRQARTDGSLFEPSDHAPSDMHHNSQADRKARIIVQNAAIGFGYWPMGKAVLSAAHKG